MSWTAVNNVISWVKLGQLSEPEHRIFRPLTSMSPSWGSQPQEFNEPQNKSRIILSIIPSKHQQDTMNKTFDLTQSLTHSYQQEDGSKSNNTNVSSKLTGGRTVLPLPTMTKIHQYTMACLKYTNQIYWLFKKKSCCSGIIKSGSHN